MPNDSPLISIIGTGALGGFYGGLMAKAGFEVHFLARSDFSFIQKNGLRVDSKWGDFTLEQVSVHGSPTTLPKSDIVFICLKTTQNSQLATILPPLCKPNTLLCTLQNGLGIEEQIAKIVPDHLILGGLCFLCSNKVGPGHIHHLDYGQIRLGVHVNNENIFNSSEEDSHQQALKKVANVLEKSSIPLQIVNNLKLARWQKLVWNVPFNGLSVVLGENTQTILSNIEYTQLVLELMTEVQTCAKLDGVELSSKFIEKMISDTKKMTPYKPSMLLDFEKKSPMEIEAIYYTPLARSHQNILAGQAINTSRVPNPILLHLYQTTTKQEFSSINQIPVLQKFPLAPNMSLLWGLLLFLDSETRL